MSKFLSANKIKTAIPIALAAIAACLFGATAVTAFLSDRAERGVLSIAAVAVCFAAIFLPRFLAVKYETPSFCLHCTGSASLAGFSVVFLLLSIQCSPVAIFAAQCALSVLFTVFYGLAHEKAVKGKKGSREYLIRALLFLALAAVACAVTSLAFCSLPIETFGATIGGDTTWRDVIPWLIGLKTVADALFAFDLFPSLAF